MKYIETSVIAGDQPEDIKLLFSNVSMSNSPAFNEDGSCSKQNLHIDTYPVFTPYQVVVTHRKIIELRFVTISSGYTILVQN